VIHVTPPKNPFAIKRLMNSRRPDCEETPTQPFAINVLIASGWRWSAPSPALPDPIDTADQIRIGDQLEGR